MRTFEEIQADTRQAKSINDAAALLRFVTELDALATPQAEAEASNARGWVLYLRADYPGALDHYHSALALYDELGDRSGVAGVTGNIGIVHSNTGDYPAALEHFQQALALNEELGDRNGVAGTTCNIGLVHSSTGDYPAALEHFHRALALCEELGIRHFAANITGNIGNVHVVTGDYPAGLAHHHRALALHEVLGNLSGVASASGNIGLVHFRTGDYPAALEHYHSALALFTEHGDRSGMARATGNIGLVHADTGDHTSALEHYHHALALHEELGERKGVAFITGSIVATYVTMGSDAKAQALLRVMDTIHIDDPVIRVDRDRQRATLQERSGDLDGATVTLQRALAEAQEHGLRSRAASSHKSLRDLALTQSNLAAYVEHNNEYTRITEEINGKDTATKIAMQAKQREIDAERREVEKHMAILHSTLPKHIADRIARGETVNDHYDNVAVIFLDVVGFTTHSSELDASTVVALLEKIFTTFDAICSQHSVMKIKTIGDSYMAVAFPEAENIHVLHTASVALAMMASAFHWPHNNEKVMFRIGIHSGPVVAGVLGTARMQYDVWGDTVNVASRMESTSEPGRIHISQEFADALAPIDLERDGAEGAGVRYRGEMEIKGKGSMHTYWLESTT